MSVLQAVSAPIAQAMAERPGWGAKVAFVVGLILIALSAAAALYTAAAFVCFVIYLAGLI